VGYSWGTLNCADYKDQYDRAKDTAKENNIEIPDDQKKYYYKWRIDRCERRKGMHDMEYTAFIFDIVIGFICGLIGLLHLFDLKKDFVVNTGIIGLICGAVGFVLTFVYVIFNGMVYTTYGNGDYKRDGDGVFAEKTETNKYKCLYFDKLYNTHALQATYADLGKKQYNYKKDFLKGVDGACVTGFNSDCENQQIIDVISSCDKLYISAETGIENKDISDRFLTALILSLIVCLANIGLALFGFLLFRTPSDF
jgi:hypothetical protein